MLLAAVISPLTCNLVLGLVVPIPIFPSSFIANLVPCEPPSFVLKNKSPPLAAFAM